MEKIELLQLFNLLLFVCYEWRTRKEKYWQIEMFLDTQHSPNWQTSKNGAQPGGTASQRKKKDITFDDVIVVDKQIENGNGK